MLTFWRTAKVADGIADPTAQPELFQDGWNEALEKKKEVRTLTVVVF